MKERQGASYIKNSYEDIITQRIPEELVVQTFLAGIESMPTIYQMELFVNIGRNLVNNKQMLNASTSKFEIPLLKEIILLLESFLYHQKELQNYNDIPTNNKAQLMKMIKTLSFQELMFWFGTIAKAAEEHPNIELVSPDKSIKSLGNDLYNKTIKFTKRLMKKIPGRNEK